MDNYIHIIVGIIILGFGLLSLIVIHRRKFWPETVANILISRVCEEEPAEFKANTLAGGVPSGALARRTKSMKMHATYTPYLLYKYEVDGKIYQGKNMYSGLISSLDNNILRFFSEGNAYPARYNPSAPEKSYLMFSPAWRYYLLMIVGLCTTFYPEIFGFLKEVYANSISNK